MSVRWSGTKYRIQQPIVERLFGLRGCLPKLATEHKGRLRPEVVEGRRAQTIEATTKERVKQPQNQERPDNMKGGKK
jgi:hypothetical protein